MTDIVIRIIWEPYEYEPGKFSSGKGKYFIEMDCPDGNKHRFRLTHNVSYQMNRVWPPKESERPVLS